MALFIENEGGIETVRIARAAKHSISLEPIIHRTAVVSAFLFVILVIAVF